MRLRIGIAAVAMLAAFCTYSQAAVEVDDFETHDATWWEGNGTSYSLPKLDAENKYRVFTTKVALAKTNPIPTHCRDKSGTDRCHFHWKADYDDVTAANRYWNWRFQDGKDGILIQRSDATNKINCYAWVLNYLIDNGTYEYWIDQNYSAAHNAILADTDGVAKANVASFDMLYYQAADHATGVLQVRDGQIVTLKWKFHASGVYELSRTTFDTPKCVGADPAVGSVPNWTWSWSGAGSEAQLFEGKVRHKK